MPHNMTGIERRGKWYRVKASVNGKPVRTKFRVGTVTFAEMQAWRTTQQKTAVVISAGSFEEDVARYLALATVAAMPYVHQYARYLALWVDELHGAQRPRSSITRDQVEAVIQRWLRTYQPATVYHRRTALLSMYVALNEDTPDAPNPVKGTTCPKAWSERNHAKPFPTLRAIYDAMPDVRYIAKGVTAPSVAKLVVGIMLHCGVRPIDLSRVPKGNVFPLACDDAGVPERRRSAGVDVVPQHPRAARRVACVRRRERLRGLQPRGRLAFVQARGAARLRARHTDPSLHEPAQRRRGQLPDRQGSRRNRPSTRPSTRLALHGDLRAGRERRRRRRRDRRTRRGPRRVTDREPFSPAGRPKIC